MKRIVTVIIVALAALAAVFALLVSRGSSLAWIVEQEFPELFPPAVWARNLHSKNPEMVRDSLYYLSRHRSLAGEARAVQLLESPDDYVWLNAALYLGTIGNGYATPYLIKGLRHTAVLADKESVTHLRDITGMNFGNDFARWQQWWLAQNPGSKDFDWESHLGSDPRLPSQQPSF